MYGPENAWFEDYQRFVGLFVVVGKVDSLTFAKNVDRVDRYFGWVNGGKEYLDG